MFSPEQYERKQRKWDEARKPQPAPREEPPPEAIDVPLSQCPVWARIKTPDWDPHFPFPLITTCDLWRKADKYMYFPFIHPREFVGKHLSQFDLKSQLIGREIPPR